MLVFAKHLPPLSQCTEIRKYKYTKTELPVTLEIDISEDNCGGNSIYIFVFQAFVFGVVQVNIERGFQ